VNSDEPAKQLVHTHRGRVRRWFWRPEAPEGSSRLTCSFEDACAGGAELNEDVIRMFLWQSFVGGEETLARGVRCLPGDADFEMTRDELKLLERRWYEFGAELPDTPLEEMLAAAKEAWSRAVAAELERGGASHCLAISSGLDSRLILGELLEHLPASELTTYSWGSPGTWDATHAPEVARAAGTRHTILDYADHAWSADLIRETARETDGNAPVNISTSLERMKSELEGAVYWVGFLGEASAGGHLPPVDTTDPVGWFLGWNQRPATSRRFAANLAPELRWHVPLEHGEPGLPPLRAAESIEFHNRQERRVANRVLPRSFDLRTPFVRPEWTSLILRAPRRYREGRMLQREMLRHFYPRLARIPSGSLGGRALLGDARSEIQPLPRAWHYARVAGYVLGYPPPIYPSAIHTHRDNVRTREDLRSAIGELMEAAARRPFLDGRRVRRLWRNFLARRELKWDRVDRVASLEANLQAHGL
jgi:hypothetical protein